MTHYTETHAAFAPTGSLLHRILARAGNLLVNSSIANARARSADRLQAMTDAQLRKEGVVRRDIAAHAFRGMLWT